MGLLIYTMLLGHLAGYAKDYMRIGTTFAVTIMIKLIVKANGSKEHATMIGLGGGFVGVKQMLELVEKVTKRGFEWQGIAGTGDTGDGLIADMFDKILASLKENLTIHD